MPSIDGGVSRVRKGYAVRFLRTSVVSSGHIAARQGFATTGWSAIARSAKDERHSKTRS
jgi:hypothetical protein